MSRSSTEKMQCPHCKAEQEISVYTTVNTVLNPEIKEQILRGKFNVFSCTDCKKEIRVVSELLYHDMEKRIMIQVKDEEEVKDYNESVLSDQLKQGGYILRNVNSYTDLVEKIKVFDLNINDKVLSTIKDIFFDSFKAVIGDDKLYVYFKELKKGLFSKKVAFTMFTSPQQLLAAEFDLKKLDSNQKKDIFNIDMLRGEGWQDII